jgi:hypothetical protein
MEIWNLSQERLDELQACIELYGCPATPHELLVYVNSVVQRVCHSSYVARRACEFLIHGGCNISRSSLDAMEIWKLSQERLDELQACIESAQPDECKHESSM